MKVVDQSPQLQEEYISKVVGVNSSETFLVVNVFLLEKFSNANIKVFDMLCCVLLEFFSISYVNNFDVFGKICSIVKLCNNMLSEYKITLPSSLFVLEIVYMDIIVVRLPMKFFVIML